MSIAIALILGALTWSLLEYCIHRWMGHDKRTMPNPFATEHLRHHSEGNYFAPTYKKAGAAVILLGVTVGPSILLAGTAAGITYSLGLAAFYLFYEVLHRLEHVDSGATRYGQWARRHHFYHHFHSPKMNHGVTSPIWDVVFGTYKVVPKDDGKIVVPERLQMRWLTDPATGDVWPHLADGYELRKAKRKKSAKTVDASDTQAKAAA